MTDEQLQTETVNKAATRLFNQHYPIWLDNGLSMKMIVAKDYCLITIKAILKEFLDEYTNDENHDRIVFWNSVLKEIAGINYENHFEYLNKTLTNE